jgi:hypothetical protein
MIQTIGFIKRNCGLRSQKDKLESRNERRLRRQENKENEIERWGQIRSVNDKRTYIREYCFRQKRISKLSQMQFEQLFSVIMIGLGTKSITKDEIHFDNGVISNITGVVWNTDLQKYCLSSEISRRIKEHKFIGCSEEELFDPANKINHKKRVSFGPMWEKYVECVNVSSTRRNTVSIIPTTVGSNICSMSEVSEIEYGDTITLDIGNDSSTSSNTPPYTTSNVTYNTQFNTQINTAYNTEINTQYNTTNAQFVKMPTIELDIVG